MRGLKIIPMFLILIVLSYFGMWFVDLNRNEVTLNIGTYVTSPTALGFVVLTAVLIGMLISGLFCSIEILALFMQNRRLRRRVVKPVEPMPADEPALERDLSPRATGRFT